MSWFSSWFSRSSPSTAAAPSRPTRDSERVQFKMHTPLGATFEVGIPTETFKPKEVFYVFAGIGLLLAGRGWGAAQIIQAKRAWIRK